MRYLVSLLILCVLVILGGSSSKAESGNAVINKFVAQYVLDNQAVGGSLETYETIDITLGQPSHGILRAIPTTYHHFDTKLQVRGVVRDDKSEPYTTYQENGNLVLKIGDPNVTLTGKHTYKLYYYQERIVNFDGNPEFYWDVNGTQWPQDIEQLEARVKIKEGNYALKKNNTYCYTGVEGSKSIDCKITHEGEEVVYKTTKPLLASENMSIAVSLDGINFIKPGNSEKLKDNVLNLVGLAIGLTGFIVIFWLWVKYGKDYRGKGVIVPEYEPPKGLTPAEVGMLADYAVDGKDLSATLIDLAVRKYLKLHEEVKKIFFVTTRSYTVELLKQDLSGLNSYEKRLIEALFDEIAIGQKTELSKLKPTKMSKAVQDIKKDLDHKLKKDYGYIESKSTALQVWFFVFGVSAGFSSFFFFSYAWGISVGLICIAIGFVLFGSLMRRRSHAGVEVYEQILGLKMFMNVAEKDRLKMMQSVERPFAEPSKTVELFETLLPFAVALGVEKSWAKQFDGILKEQPEWINSNSVAGFSGAHLATSIAGATTNFSSSFESSSGTSGSSGGGSSGGGGGGGGGGTW